MRRNTILWRLFPWSNLNRVLEDAEALEPRTEPSPEHCTPTSTLSTQAQSQPSHLKATESPASTTSTQQPTKVRPGKSEERLLIDILHESAELRRKSAEVDERLAQYYERLLVPPKATSPNTQSMIEGEQSQGQACLKEPCPSRSRHGED